MSLSVSTQKGFRPILPTKEIPRTPLGVATTGPAVDSCFTGHNLPVSAAPLNSSNTFTPYDHRTSSVMTGRGKKAAAKKDAVVPEVETPEAQAPLVAEAVEVSEAPEVKKGRGKAKAILEEAPVAEIKEMKGRGKKAQPPAKKKQKVKMVAEPEVAEKKDHDKKAHQSADSASQVASEVDTPEARAPLVAEAVEVFEAPEVKKVCGKAKAKSFMSRNSAPVPSRSSVEVFYVFICAWKSNFPIFKCVRLKLFSLLRIWTNPVKEAVGRKNLYVQYPRSTLKKKQLKR